MNDKEFIDRTMEYDEHGMPIGDKVYLAVHRMLDEWDQHRFGNDRWGIRKAIGRPLPPLEDHDEIINIPT